MVASDVEPRQYRPAPKDLRANIAYRRRVWEMCATDRMAQHDAWIRGSRDIVWWTDTFAWTYSPKDEANQPHRPFILYPFQETAVKRINRAIGGRGLESHDVLVEKSRDMGASWICLLVLFWRWLFLPGQSFLVGSRVQDYVDKKGNPKALFYKLDYLYERLPPWMKPMVEETAMHRANESNGSVIDGESTTPSFGRGDRRTAGLLDEFAEIQVDGYAVLSATRDMTSCRIFNSTPAGASGAYYDTREKMRKHTPERIVTLHWSAHPLKNCGLYTTVDGKPGSKIKILDESYRFPAGYPFINDGKVRSPWYDEQCRRAAHPQEIATQLDIDYAGSGWQFFEPAVIQDLIDKHAKPPVIRGEISFDTDLQRAIFTPNAKGRLQFWFTPEPDGQAPKPFKDVVVACDIAAGTGGEESSNSVASIVDRATGTKIGQFHSNRIFPLDFARYSVCLCRYFHDATLIWEKNGPGGVTFTNEIVAAGYRNVYYQRDDASFEGVEAKKPGWQSTRTGKSSLLSAYSEALMYGQYLNQCEEALRECLEYVHEPSGDIVHVRSRESVDPTSVGESHGDMVIADALAAKLVRDRKIEQAAVEDVEYLPGTFGYRLMKNLHEANQPRYY